MDQPEFRSDDLRPSDVAKPGFHTNIIFGSHTSIHVVEDLETVARLMTEAGQR